MATIAYVTFMKHAQKVTKAASNSRPALKGVFHAENGSLVVTDSHRLYIAKNAHSDAGKLIDPKTGANIDNTYPDVSRLIPDSGDAKYTARLTVKEAVDSFTALLKANHAFDKRTVMTDAELIDGELVFSVDNKLINAKYTTGAHADGQGDKMTFSTQYFVDALAMFKDAGVSEVTMRYYGSTRPFTLSAGKDDELLALLLPIRRAVD